MGLGMIVASIAYIGKALIRNEEEVGSIPTRGSRKVA